MPDANTQLMQTIRDKFGAEIEAACATSSVPPAFLAALIANESGGNPDAKRFEKGVLAQLWEVIMGRAAAFGSVTRSDILDALPRDFLSGSVALDQIATSWGLTQIMGYEIIPFGGGLQGLQNPASSLPITCRMLAQFAERFQLDQTKDFDELFRCWNGGRPHSATYDPNYSTNGQARMAIYAGLPSVASAVAGEPAEAPAPGSEGR